MIKMSLEKQEKYCKERNLPMFAFEVCPTCGHKTEDTDKEHITGCKNCGRKFTTRKVVKK